jgi:hypothetical protein
VFYGARWTSRNYFFSSSRVTETVFKFPWKHLCSTFPCNPIALQPVPHTPDKNKPVQNWSNPPEIRQKLGTRQKYFLPARQLSNPPELSKSGGENRHLATLQSTAADGKKVN